MATIEILDRGTIDPRDSAFPQVVELPNDDLLASYSNHGGQAADGGTDWSRSSDGGRSWRVEGTLLAPSTDPESTNYLKLSLSRDGTTIYAYGARSWSNPHAGFGMRSAEPIVMTSTDDGHTWSKPLVVPMPTNMLEISHGILALRSGRLLAPAATIPGGRYGEQVLVAISDDGGRTWPRVRVAMEDPHKRVGYLEQKIAELSPGRQIASAWTTSFGALQDSSNTYALSDDEGEHWSAPRSIGTPGQTISVVPLWPETDESVMLLYNRRYGRQGIVMAVARLAAEDWPIEFEGLLHDAAASRAGVERESGLAEMLDFQFGFPTAIRLRDGTFLASWWSVNQPGELCGVRWARLRVEV